MHFRISAKCCFAEYFLLYKEVFFVLLFLIVLGALFNSSLNFFTLALQTAHTKHNWIPNKFSKWVLSRLKKVFWLKYFYNVYRVVCWDFEKLFFAVKSSTDINFRHFKISRTSMQKTTLFCFSFLAIYSYKTVFVKIFGKKGKIRELTFSKF